MTTPTPASRSAAPSTPTPGVIPVTCLPHLHAAANCAGLAKHYAEHGNSGACRRQLVRALGAINAVIDQGGAQ